MPQAGHVEEMLRKIEIRILDITIWQRPFQVSGHTKRGPIVEVDDD